jgi:hypothetical protein
VTFGLATRKLYPKVVRRHGEGDKSHLTTIEGLAALSLDALSSVAYGPESIMLTLAVAVFSHGLWRPSPCPCGVSGNAATAAISGSKALPCADAS